MNPHFSSIEALTASGLSERDAALWLALSTYGPMNISQLARATRLHRPAIYKLLPSLIKSHLVKELKENRRVRYQSTGIEALTRFRASRDTAFATELKKLGQKEKKHDLSDTVRVYHGKEMQHVWEDVVATTPKASVFLRYDGYTPSTKVKEYIPADYFKGIEHKHIDRFVITNGALRKSAYKKRLECASRVLPETFDAFEQGVSQFVFGDKIALIDFTTETAIVIKNQALAKYHSRVFQYLYRSLQT